MTQFCHRLKRFNDQALNRYKLVITTVHLLWYAFVSVLASLNKGLLIDSQAPHPAWAPPIRWVSMSF